MDLRIDEKGKYFTSRISKDTMPALIRTTSHVIIGNIYVRPEQRLRDDLGKDDSRFLPVTDARVYHGDNESLLYQASFLLVSFEHITMLGPLDAFDDIRPAPWQSQPEV